MGFYGSSDPTNSVKALTEGFNPTRSTPLCYNNTTHMQYDKINTKNINTKESMHSEMGPVRQNQIQRTVRTAHLSVLMTVHNFSTQYSTEQFPLHQSLTVSKISEEHGLI